MNARSLLVSKCHIKKASQLESDRIVILFRNWNKYCFGGFFMQTIT